MIKKYALTYAHHALQFVYIDGVSPAYRYPFGKPTEPSADGHRYTGKLTLTATRVYIDIRIGPENRGAEGCRGVGSRGRVGRVV